MLEAKHLDSEGAIKNSYKKGQTLMKKYLKGYTLGALLGLLFFLPVFNPALRVNFQQHWVAIVIFTPAIIYMILSYAEYSEISFKKENIIKSGFFLLGIFLSIYAMYSIWGFPE